MEIYGLERSLSSVFISHKEHTDYPEEEYIISCLKDIGWIILLEEFPRILNSPIKYREWPECR
jgi:hypothetical protein